MAWRMVCPWRFLRFTGVWPVTARLDSFEAQAAARGFRIPLGRKPNVLAEYEALAQKADLVNRWHEDRRCAEVARPERAAR